jgi:transcription termination factor NusB
MSNKDNLIIQPSDEIILHTALQSDMIIFDEEKRQKAIQILRQIPAILNSVGKLSEGKTYKAYISPKVLERIKDGSARLVKRDNGLFGANILDAKTGRIIDNASLMEVTPNLLSSLNQLATQQTLANIVQRLEVIDEKITDLLQGQINDRLAEVESGIHSYEQAIVASDPVIRRELIVSAIQKLNDGRNKLIKSTDVSFIDKMPRNRVSMFFSKYWLGNNVTEYVQSKSELIWKAAHAIVKASRYLILAYSALNEPDSLRVSLEQVESEIKNFQDKIGEIVNWLSPTSDWHENLTAISQGVLPNIRDLDNIPQKTIVVEFSPKEITHPEGV